MNPRPPKATRHGPFATLLAAPSSGLHCRHPSLQTGSLPSPVSSRPSDVRLSGQSVAVPTTRKACEDVRRSSPASGVDDAMSPCDHHVSRQRYPRLRGSRISAATGPLSVAADREHRLCLTTAKVDPSLHPTTAPKTIGNVRLPTYGAVKQTMPSRTAMSCAGMLLFPALARGIPT